MIQITGPLHAKHSEPACGNLSSLKGRMRVSRFAGQCEADTFTIALCGVTVTPSVTAEKPGVTPVTPVTPKND